MTATATTVRRPRRTQLTALAAAVLCTVVLVGIVRTVDVPIIGTNPAPIVQPVSNPAALANEFATARSEVAALRGVVRAAPSIRVALHDHIALLQAVNAGHVPAAALESADDVRLRAAVAGGHVPPAALEPVQ